MKRATLLMGPGAAGAGLVDGLLAWQGHEPLVDVVSFILTVTTATLVYGGVGLVVGALVPTAPFARRRAMPPWIAATAGLLVAGGLIAWGPPPPVGAPDGSSGIWLALALAGAGLALSAVPRIGGWFSLIPALATLLVALPLPPPQGQGPRIVLITVDGLRADALPVDGAMARAAASGVRFDRAVTPVPSPGPAHVALHTGRGPWDTGIVHDGVALPDSPTLAERLQAAGWTSAAVVSSDLVAGGLGFSRGFDTYDDDPAWIRGLDRIAPGRLLKGLGLLGRPGSRPAPFTLERVHAALARHPDFLWVHFQDPLGPYAPGDPWDKRFVGTSDPTDPARDGMSQALPLSPEHGDSLDGVTDPDWVIGQYRGEVALVDHQIGALLELVPDEAMLVIAGTTGESLGEGGRWFRHGEAWPAEVSVPLILRAPDLPAGEHIPWPVELSDVAPTLLELADVRVPDAMTGASLTTAARGRPLRAVARSLASSGPMVEGRVQAIVMSTRAAARTTSEGQVFRIRPDGTVGDPIVEGRLGDVARPLAEVRPSGRTLTGPGGSRQIQDLGGTVSQ